MKQIEAVIQHVKLPEVRDALYEMGVEEFMESDLICHSHQKGRAMTFRGAKLYANSIRKVKLEIIAADESVDPIVNAIGSVANCTSREECRIAVRPYLEVN